MNYDEYKQADDLHGREQHEEPIDELYDFWKELTTILRPEKDESNSNH